jgi:S-adenosylmethionine:tRNA ribosyltransferase-isomerase
LRLEVRENLSAMRTELFDFDLPPELIAQHPIRPRDAARLLVVRAAGLEDRGVLDLPALLRPGDLLVLNDTRVLPVRLYGRRGAAAIEVTLTEPVAHEAQAAALGEDEGDRPAGAALWRAFARPARKCRPGDRLDFTAELVAEVVGRGEGGEVTLRFRGDATDLAEGLRRHGAMPLPPYIRRPRGGEVRDLEDYQSLFAKREGAVAAPTAALHFTPRLMTALAARGIDHAFLTLHVGAGTFLPVKVADVRDHEMHAERFELGVGTAARIDRARAAGGRVVAVGTTVLRTLETIADATGKMVPAAGATRLFITPGYRFRAVDLLMTNFHLPRSTLFMLVAAFAGLERMQRAYAHAIAGRYRFYSYGDACLLERAEAA